MSLAADFGLTLTQHVLRNQASHPDARGQFSALLTQIGVAVTGNATIAILAGSIAVFLAQRPFWLAVQRRAMGTVLGALAVNMATEARR